MNYLSLWTYCCLTKIYYNRTVGTTAYSFAQKATAEDSSVTPRLSHRLLGKCRVSWRTKKRSPCGKDFAFFVKTIV